MWLKDFNGVEMGVKIKIWYLLFFIFFIVKENEHKKLIKHLEEEKTNLTRKLKLTQKMLDEQLEKINAHVSHLAQFMREGIRW